MNPRDEAMSADLAEATIPEWFDPSIEPVFLTIDDSADLLEHTLVTTLLHVMNSAARDSDKLKAASDVAEILGRKGKQAVTIVQSENAQINQITAPPQMNRHLIEAAKGLKKISSGNDAKIKTREGGSGV